MAPHAPGDPSRPGIGASQPAGGHNGFHPLEYRARRSSADDIDGISDIDDMLSLWWVNESTTPGMAKAFEGWFGRCDPAAGSPTDPNYLAHALTAGGFLKEVAAVFQTVGDYATLAPSLYIAHHSELWWEESEVIRRACRRRLQPSPNAGGRPCIPVVRSAGGLRRAALTAQRTLPPIPSCLCAEILDAYISTQTMAAVRAAG
ncbi:hypothetical protein ABZ543_11890 [Streptomyces roseifaciens]